MKTIVLPALVITAVGAAVGMGFNSVRTEGRIILGRNYFQIARHPDSTPLTDRGAGAGIIATRSSDSKGGGTGDSVAGTAPKIVEHDFKVIDTKAMMELVWSQDAFNGFAVFIDARDHETYHAGHVPGAFNVYNYDVDKFYPVIAPCIEAAETVVVYCGGGSCEDSIFLATELTRRGIAFGRLHVYEEGWKGWSASGDEIQTDDAECAMDGVSVAGGDGIHGDTP
ncbi:MAG: rhodanese-like domain-containing protein [Phycisphaerales bacterium]|nr:rhodanese-like domain-containing protein [Phycisphaerales bacterium]